MAASSTAFNHAKYLLATGALDLSTGDIKCLLTTSTFTPDIDAHQFLTSVANEVTGNGYARQTLTYSGVTRVGKDDTNDRTAFKSENVEFTASGGSIVARRAIFFKDTGVAGTSPLLFHVLLDTTPADVTATDGQKLRITMPTNGWLTLG